MFLTDVTNLIRESRAKVSVQCDVGEVDDCAGVDQLQYNDAMRIVEQHDGKYVCLKCSDNRLNVKSSHFDCCMMTNIDTIAKAYLLGWFGSNGSIEKKTWSIKIAVGKYDVQCLNALRDIVNAKLVIAPQSGSELMAFTIRSKQMVEDTCKHFQIESEDDSDRIYEKCMKYPNLTTEEMQWAFIRGYFDGKGGMTTTDSTCLEVTLPSASKSMLIAIGAFCNIPHIQDDNHIVFHGTNAIDFMGKMYVNSGRYRLPSNYETYEDWMTWGCHVACDGSGKRLPECLFYKADKDAVLPCKSKASDIGYDLTVIKEAKRWLNNITLYDTGLKTQVAHGLYAEVVPRSSLSKSGYMLANSIGIIDPSYRGNIFVALVKVDPSAPDIELPFRCCQIVFRVQHQVDIVEVADDFEATSRGNGGFGSTGK